jgi:cytochrome oxidase assembly protein ShyY1
MDWLTQLTSDPHTAYVATAFGLAFALLGVEVLLLRRRYRAVSAPAP